MKQEQIDYSKIKGFGFTEEPCEDMVYFEKYGFPYAIIQFQLTNLIYLQWDKETRLCKMVRVDCEEEQNIISEMNIVNANQLKDIIDFFGDKKEDKQFVPIYA